jgi:TonB family protein
MSLASKNTIEIPAPGAELDVSAGGSAPQASTPVCWEIPVRIYGPRGSANVSGKTEQTEPFLEETHTLILFPQGGVVRLSAHVAAGQALLLTNEHTNHEVLCRVTSVRAAANAQAYVEFEFTKPQDSFWGVHCPSDSPAPESAPVSAAAPVVSSAPVAATTAPAATTASAKRVEAMPREPSHEERNSGRTSQELPAATGSSAVVPVPPAVSAQITSSPSAPAAPQSSRDVWNESFPSKALRLDPVPAAPPDPTPKKRPSEAPGIRRVAKPAGNFITPSAIGAISAAADSVIAAEMPVEAPNAAGGPLPLARPPLGGVAKERVPKEKEPQPIAPQATKDPVNSLFSSPTGAEFHGAAPQITGTSSPRAIGDSLGDLGDWKTPPQIPPSSGRSSPQRDFGSRLGNRTDHHAVVTQVEEERDPKRFWIFGGTGVGVLIVLSILMFSHSPAKTAASTPATEDSIAPEPPKPPSPWDAKSFVSTSRASLAPPPSKKSAESDSDIFLDDPPSQSKASSTVASPEASARPKQNKQFIPSERSAPVQPVAAPRQDSAGSLPESTMRKLASQPAVPEKSAEQNKVTQAAAAPPDVRANPASSPQNGLSGISPAPAAEAPASPQEAAPQGPLRVGGKIKAPQLLHSVPPQYPNMARQAHVEGDVVVDMVIDASGKVTTMKVVSGPLLLRDAATTALRQWQYQPTLLNEQPVPVEMEVLIKFKM